MMPRANIWKINKRTKTAIVLEILTDGAKRNCKQVGFFFYSNYFIEFRYLFSFHITEQQPALNNHYLKKNNNTSHLLLNVWFWFPPKAANVYVSSSCLDKEEVILQCRLKTSLGVL